MKGAEMEMTDRRARILEAVADSCRRELALEEAKKDAAAEFNDQIKALKTEREQLLKDLDFGADPTELPFDEETEYPMPVLDGKVTITLDEEGEHAEPDPDDPGPEADDIDPGRFFE